MGVAEHLHPERVCFLRARDKAGALEQLIRLLATSEAITDIDDLRRGILNREDLMSTGIGFGLGIPHVRLESVRGMVMGVGIQPEGLADYEALDGQPVRILVMIAAGGTAPGAYIRLLGEVTHLLKAPAVREAVLAAATPQAVYEALAVA